MDEVSVYLPFDSIHNCRDLAGIKTCHHKVIKPGMLIRSGHLGHANRQDLLTLQGMGIKNVVDLRTTWETTFFPDHPVPESTYIHDPVYRETDLSQDAGGQAELVEEAAKDSRQLMCSMYASSMSDKDAIAAWKEFFNILKNNEGGILFHCTQGKDRTGMAAMLLETALGVSPEDRLKDYLQTNLYMVKEANKDEKLVQKVAENFEVTLDDDIDSYLYAHKSYYDAAQNKVIEMAGSWEGYLIQILGLTEEDLKVLQEKFLIDEKEAAKEMKASQPADQPV
ncbi:tyrosine-protein phosphatase [Allobaculum sp. JKK-2023]|uniref:tyrosine-protein phosphatase n=1 Tax=Allobaculum sp. JKK-2023 TaxID=3108943 RepID=UPI002B05A996|nr:tyrosine-protein phosphatase [Allobaculum sp. JKK-2023]